MAGRNGKSTQVDEREVLLDREVRPLLRGRLLTTDVNKDLSVTEAADAWQCLDLVKGKIEERLKELREVLMSAAERDGQETEKGGYMLPMDGARIEKQRRQKNEPDQKKMLGLLAQRGIETKDVYDEVKTLVYNPSKTEYLTDTGKLSDEEVDALKPVSFALKVTKSDEWAEMFDQAGQKKTRRRAPPPRRAVR